VEDPVLKDYFGDELIDFTKNIDYSFGNEGLYKKMSYSLNPELYEEIYSAVKLIVEDPNDFYCKRDIDFLVSELLGFFSVEEKIKFLKTRYREYLSQDDDVSLFLLYLGKNIHANYTSWEDYICDSLNYDDKFI